MSRSKKPHDHFFKAVFSNKREAADLIRAFVSKEIVKEIDFRTFRREVDSYTDEDLEEYFSDIVYSCRLKGQKTKICLLFEHKSQKVKYPHFQLLRYMENSWEMDLKQKRALRPIIPILFYHGKTKWPIQKLSDYFKNSSEILLKYFPNFEYELIDLSKYSDAYISQLKRNFYVNALLLLKHQKEKAYIIENANVIFVNGQELFPTEEGEIFLRQLLIYLLQTNNFEKQEWKLLVNKLDDKLKISVMNSYDKWMKEGIAIGKEEGIAIGQEKGKEEGIAIGQEKGKEEGIAIGQEKGIAIVIKSLIQKFPEYTDQQIAKMTGIDTEFVKRIRAETK